jgi:hypothetical protein
MQHLRPKCEERRRRRRYQRAAATNTWVHRNRSARRDLARRCSLGTPHGHQLDELTIGNIFLEQASHHISTLCPLRQRDDTLWADLHGAALASCCTRRPLVRHGKSLRFDGSGKLRGQRSLKKRKQQSAKHRATRRYNRFGKGPEELGYFKRYPYRHVRYSLFALRRSRIRQFTQVSLTCHVLACLVVVAGSAKRSWMNLLHVAAFGTQTVSSTIFYSMLR